MPEKCLQIIKENKYDNEIKENPMTGKATDYLDDFYSLCVLTEYMIMNHHLNYSFQKIRDDLNTTGYFEKRGKKLFYWKWIDRPIMTAEHFFFHLFSLPVDVQFDDESKCKLYEITHEYSSIDNLPELRFEFVKMKLFIGKPFVNLCYLIIFNIIGDIYAISIATEQSFDYITTKIFIGIFISTSFIVFLYILKYIFILTESDFDSRKEAHQ